MAFFITRENRNQKMGMSPFAGPVWTSKGVGLMEEKQASLEGAFMSDSRRTTGPYPAYDNYGTVVVSNALTTRVFSFIRFTNPA